MNYDDKINKIVDFIKAGETAEEDFRVGFEAEHFIVDADTIETLTYEVAGGVRDSLTDLAEMGLNPTYEGDAIMGLAGDGYSISIEPGSQFELAFDAKKTIDELFDEYVRVMGKIVPIFDKKNQLIIQTGYQPKTRIDEISFIPKKRYDYMAKYFLDHGGDSPFNMMKGSGSLQVAIDFLDEDDFRKKYFVANAISTFLYSTFENSYIFEGKPYQGHNLRQSIWEDCDPNRSGVFPFAFEEGLSYESYARQILLTDSIFIKKNDEDIYTGTKKFEEIFDEDSSVDMVNHALSIVFPDVRVKTYIEVRMPDNVPYPYNFAAIALIKNIFYDKDILDWLYNELRGMTYGDFQKLKLEARRDGIYAKYNDKPIYEWMLDIISHIKDDRKYIDPIRDLLQKQMTPGDIYKALYKKDPVHAAYEFSVNKFVKDQYGED